MRRFAPCIRPVDSDGEERTGLPIRLVHARSKAAAGSVINLYSIRKTQTYFLLNIALFAFLRGYGAEGAFRSFLGMPQAAELRLLGDHRQQMADWIYRFQSYGTSSLRLKARTPGSTRPYVNRVTLKLLSSGK
jgi:hypothetical protein